MPWKVESLMSCRREFVTFAGQPDANLSSLCRRFGISRKTGYKWLARGRAEPAGGRTDASGSVACEPAED